MKHAAIYTSNKQSKEKLIRQIFKGELLQDISGLHSHGELVSEIALAAFKEEELIHDHFEIIPSAHRELHSFSDGEQKKALLQYAISKNPDFIVIDNIFDHLDIASQKNIHSFFEGLKEKLTVIQILNRKNELLGFMDMVFEYENNILKPFASVQEFMKQDEVARETGLNLDLPEAVSDNTTLINPLIKFTDVSVQYGEQKVLNKINWTINRGEFWQLRGPNGSGKSTIVSLINGDNSKAYGQQILLFGKLKGSGETVWEVKKQLGYFSGAASYRFSRLDTIEQMVVSGFFDSIGLYTIPTERQKKIADEWLRIAGLYSIKEQPFLNLSSGYQRLVMILRAMVKYPSLLLLDEPTAGLDDYDTHLVATLVRRISSQKNTAIIYVSHRNDSGLSPDYIYELLPGKEGSTGKVI